MDFGLFCISFRGFENAVNSHLQETGPFHLIPKNVSYNTRLSGNEGQCFLYEGHKLIACHMSLHCLSTLIYDTRHNNM